MKKTILVCVSCCLLAAIISCTSGNKPPESDIKNAIVEHAEEALQDNSQYELLKIEDERVGNTTETSCPLKVLALIKEKGRVNDQVLVYLEFIFIKANTNFGPKKWESTLIHCEAMQDSPVAEKVLRKSMSKD
jgi:hypothetical protein